MKRLPPAKAPVVDGLVEGMGQRVRQPFPIMHAGFRGILPVLKQQPGLEKAQLFPDAGSGLLTPGNAALVDGSAVSIQKAHLVAEKARDVFEGLRCEAQPVAVIDGFHEILHFGLPEGVEAPAAVQVHFALFQGEPLALAVREMRQHPAVAAAGGPAVFIVQPKGELQLPGAEDDAGNPRPT